MTVPVRFTPDDAERAGHYYVPLEDGPLYVADCIDDAGERCWSFAPTGSREAATRSWIEHAAEQAGVCWACSQPDDGCNREDCRRCWLVFHARRGYLPVHAPPWPGDEPLTERP